METIFSVGLIVKHIETNEKFRVARDPDDEIIDGESLISLDAIEQKKEFSRSVERGLGYYHPRRLVRAKKLIPQIRDL